MIFNRIILVKFAKEYTNLIRYISDDKDYHNYYQNLVFNSTDMMCCIFQYLTYGLQFDGDLVSCGLVNTIWLYHVWNIHSIYFVDLTQLIYFTASILDHNWSYGNNMNSSSVERMWQRLIGAKHIYISSNRYLEASNVLGFFVQPNLHHRSVGKLKKVFDNIAPSFHDVQRLTLMFETKYNKSIFIFWRIINSIVKKNNGQVELMRSKLIDQESPFLNQELTVDELITIACAIQRDVGIQRDRRKGYAQTYDVDISDLSFDIVKPKSKRFLDLDVQTRQRPVLF